MYDPLPSLDALAEIDSPAKIAHCPRCNVSIIPKVRQLEDQQNWNIVECPLCLLQRKVSGSLVSLAGHLGKSVALNMATEMLAMKKADVEKEIKRGKWYCSRWELWSPREAECLEENVERIKWIKMLHEERNPPLLSQYQADADAFLQLAKNAQLLYQTQQELSEWEKETGAKLTPEGQAQLRKLLAKVRAAGVAAVQMEASPIACRLVKLEEQLCGVITKSWWEFWFSIQPKLKKIVPDDWQVAEKPANGVLVATASAGAAEDSHERIRTVTDVELKSVAPQIMAFRSPDKEVAWFITNDGQKVAKIVIDKIERTYLGYVWTASGGGFTDATKMMLGQPYQIKDIQQVEKMVRDKLCDGLSTQAANTINAVETAKTAVDEKPLAPEVLQWLRDLRSSSHETQFAALSEIGKRSSLRLDDRVTISVAEALANMTWQNQTSAIKFVLPNDPKLLGYLEQLAKRYADKPHHVVYMDATNKIKSIKAK